MPDFLPRLHAPAEAAERSRVSAMAAWRGVAPAETKATEAFRRAANAYTKKAMSSEKAANRVLIRLGIQDAKGNLTARYRP